MLKFYACEIVRDTLTPRRIEATFSRPEMGWADQRVFMDENVQKSCWGVTVWTVIALGGALALLILFNDVDSAQQTAAAVK